MNKADLIGLILSEYIASGDWRLFFLERDRTRKITPEEVQQVAALSTMADSLPGLGIVAAVLGVVITMGALGGPPEEIGHKVAAALVGTFLGILLCYGFIGPVASTMAKTTDDEQAYYYVLRVVLVSFIKGSPPTVAVEFGRRAIPGHVRPTFQEAEASIKNKGAEAAPAAAAA